MEFPTLDLMIIQQKAVRLLLLLPKRPYPILCRIDVLECAGKSSSQNPIKYIAANNVMKIVEKKEVRRQGKPSHARKPFTEDEYEFVM